MVPLTVGGIDKKASFDAQCFGQIMTMCSKSFITHKRKGAIDCNKQKLKTVKNVNNDPVLKV